MGCFSWKDCKTKRAIKAGKYKQVALLVPKAFGQNIVEDVYDGYGRFGGQDVYDLIADWNREYLASHPEFILPYSKKTVSEFPWYEDYADLSKSREDVVKNMSPFHEWRTIGIDLACYDEDNASLHYPIKITYDIQAVYENCKPSLSDPNQGW